MADFNFYINRQGIQGRKGDKGDTGFSPTINVSTDTLDEYKLIIANESNSFETPNLRGNINVVDNGGTYLRYDMETQQISAQGLDIATTTDLGGVYMSTDTDIESMGNSSVLTPAGLADALPIYLQGEGIVTVTQDEETSKTKISVNIPSVEGFESRLSAAEAEIIGIQADVADLDADNSDNKAIIDAHTDSIANINDGIASLQQNKQAKLTAGTGIVITNDNVIYSTGGGEGGGGGDVVAAGNNTFTGSNSFTKLVALGGGARLGNSIPIEFGTSAQTGSSVVNRGTIKNETTPLDFLYPSGYESSLVANTLRINGGYNLILDAGYVKDQDGMTLEDYTYKGKILDGDGNVILSQGNVTAGEGVTINNTDNGIEIVVDNSGGGSIDTSNFVTLDTEQVITGKKIIQNRINDTISSYGNEPDGLVFRWKDAGEANWEAFIKATNSSSSGNGVLYLGNTYGGIQVEGNYFHVEHILPKFGATSIYVGAGNNDDAAMFFTERRENMASLWIRSGGDAGLYAALNTSSIVAGDNISLEKDTEKGIVTISATGGGGGATIDDTTASTTTTYSSSKIDKLTNIASADESITVTKSDTGVDLAVNKKMVATYGFPSSNATTITVGATGTQYVAPADGYFQITGVASGATVAYYTAYIVETNIRDQKWIPPNFQGNSVSGFLFCKKGQKLTLSYYGMDINSLLFIRTESEV